MNGAPMRPGEDVVVIKTEIALGSCRVPVHAVNTVVIGCGAAGTSCALHLHDFFRHLGVEDAHERIVVVTHASRRRRVANERLRQADLLQDGHQPRVPDTAVDFAKTLTAVGCCHGDLALAEGIGSLREFYHLVQAGVPFPHDPEGAYIGYKTDHDPVRARHLRRPQDHRGS